MNQVMTNGKWLIGELLDAALILYQQHMNNVICFL